LAKRHGLPDVVEFEKATDLEGKASVMQDVVEVVMAIDWHPVRDEVGTVNGQVVFAYRHRHPDVDAVENERREVVNRMQVGVNEASTVRPVPFPHRDVLGIPDDDASVLAP
jgi:hypothetical protein